MRIEILTLFPDLFDSFLNESLIGKALQQNLVEVNRTNFRKHGLGRHRHVDDTPYGGGAGMILRPEPVVATLRERQEELQQAGFKAHKVLITPQGRPFRQADAKRFASMEAALMLICGRYEGFDERVRHFVDEEISGGDFICMGGEVIAMTIMEATIRLLPGVLGNEASKVEESFSEGLLEFPQYTRPPEFEGYSVPDILLSGHHQKVELWRKQQAEKRTQIRRPDLLRNGEQA